MKSRYWKGFGALFWRRGPRDGGGGDKPGQAAEGTEGRAVASALRLAQRLQRDLEGLRGQGWVPRQGSEG